MNTHIVPIRKLLSILIATSMLFSQTAAAFGSRSESLQEPDGVLENELEEAAARLYRTRVVLRQARDIARVEEMGTLVLASSGTITESQPTYSWDKVADATEYKVYVVDGVNNMVVSVWYGAVGICSGGSCSVTPAVTLDSDSYTWWLRARNPSGTSPWSSALGFQVQ